MERAARGGSCFLERPGGQGISDFGDEARRDEGFLDKSALEVDIRINFVGDAVVAFIALEAYVVSSRADPERLSVDLERRFPDAQVIAGGHNLDGLGVRPAVILR